MTARHVIERRTGRKWPPTRQLSKDQRDAIKRLAVQLLINQAKEKTQ